MKSWSHIARYIAFGGVGVLIALAPVPALTAPKTGHVLVVGYGPELPLLQEIGKAFEKAHPGIAVDFEWDKTVKAVDRVKENSAQIAVTDRADPSLKAIPIAWDGIAVIVNFANPVKELSTAQVKALFTGEITRWSDLDGADKKVEVIQRTVQDNVTPGFEESLGGAGRVHIVGRPVRSDQQALSAVSGRDNAVTYISLAAALKAQEDGVPIQVLTVDKVEPGMPAVQDGRYKLRRPVLFLAKEPIDQATQAFLEFVQSPEGHKIIRSMFVPYSPSGPQFVPPKSRIASDEQPAVVGERS